VTEKSADCGNFATDPVTGFDVVRLNPDFPHGDGTASVLARDPVRRRLRPTVPSCGGVIFAVITRQHNTSPAQANKAALCPSTLSIQLPNGNCPIRTRPIAPSASRRQAAGHQGEGRNSRISSGLRVDQNYASCDGSKRCGHFSSRTASASLGWHSSSQASCCPSCLLPSAFADSSAYGDFVSATLALLSFVSLPRGAGVFIAWIFILWGSPISRTVHQANDARLMAGQ